MPWNYRIVKEKTTTGDYFSIREVYWKEGGYIWGYSATAQPISGETLKDLKGDLKLYKLAFKRPVLTVEWLDAEIKKGEKHAKRSKKSKFLLDS